MIKSIFAIVFAAAVLVGCDKTVEHKDHYKQHPDGSTTHVEKDVKVDDGEMKTTEKVEIDK